MSDKDFSGLNWVDKITDNPQPGDITTTSTGDLVVSDGTTYYPLTSSTVAIKMPDPNKYNCDCCSQEFEEPNYIGNFSSSTIIYPPVTSEPTNVHYSGPGVDRHICKGCHTKALDRFFGIEHKAENVLFKK